MLDYVLKYRVSYHTFHIYNVNPYIGTFYGGKFHYKFNGDLVDTFISGTTALSHKIINMDTDCFNKYYSYGGINFTVEILDHLMTSDFSMYVSAKFTVKQSYDGIEPIPFFITTPIIEEEPTIYLAPKALV